MIISPNLIDLVVTTMVATVLIKCSTIRQRNFWLFNFYSKALQSILYTYNCQLNCCTLSFIFSIILAIFKKISALWHLWCHRCAPQIKETISQLEFLIFQAKNWVIPCQINTKKYLTFMDLGSYLCLLRHSSCKASELERQQKSQFFAKFRLMPWYVINHNFGHE